MGRTIPSALKVGLISTAFVTALGANFQCPSNGSAQRASLATLQAQIDALAVRLAAQENPPTKLVFVSSARFTGNLGGLDGADAICQGLAATAGLPGQFQAWLADAVEGPNQRFQRHLGSYVLIDGTVIASDWDGLTDGTLMAPIEETEFGQQIADVAVTWSHAKTNGDVDTNLDFHCENWTTSLAAAGFGNPHESVSEWTRHTNHTADCSFPSHLYCFQQ